MYMETCWRRFGWGCEFRACAGASFRDP